MIINNFASDPGESEKAVVNSGVGGIGPNIKKFLFNGDGSLGDGTH